MMDVYRHRPSSSDAGEPEEKNRWSGDMRFAWLILLPISLLRAAGAFLREETFGAEATLALLVVLSGAAMAAVHLATALLRYVLARDEDPDRRRPAGQPDRDPPCRRGGA